MNDLYRRDGHLTDLSLERLHYEDLDPAEVAGVREHLGRCARCAEALAEIEGMDAVPLPAIPQALLAEESPAVVPERTSERAEPEPHVAPVIPLRRRFVTVAGVLAAAALLFVVLRPPAEVLEPTDGFRPKSGAVALQVVLDDGEDGRLLEDGDVVQPNDRVGFRVRVTRPGYLAIVGLDDAGETYTCFPQGDAGEARQMPANSDFVNLNEAIRFDASPGRERLIAVWCEAPFDVEEAGRWVAGEIGDGPPARCTVTHVDLQKTAGVQ